MKTMKKTRKKDFRARNGGELEVIVLPRSTPFRLERSLICSCGCGEEFSRKVKTNSTGYYYASVEHAGRHKTEMYLQEMCGEQLALVREYLDGFASQHYKNLSKVRSAICPFVLFLNEHGVTDLEQVTPRTITEFITWAEEVDYQNVCHDISVLAGFFKWAIRHGHRKSSCPVIPKFHGKKRPHYLPRPYSTEEMIEIWSLADARGNPRLRAALAIGEEAGLRLGEICRLRQQDLDLEGRRLFIRLPNKTDCERWAYISEKAAIHIALWISQRSKCCDHDLLLHNSAGDPLSPGTLHREFCRTLCKSFQGKTLHSVGLDEWSTHRLRHTMASNLTRGGASVETIMAAGGWKSVSSMLTYAQNDVPLAQRAYNDAMRQANERASAAPVPVRTFTLEEFLAKFPRL